MAFIRLHRLFTSQGTTSSTFKLFAYSVWLIRVFIFAFEMSGIDALYSRMLERDMLERGMLERSMPGRGMLEREDFAFL
jgi:hypothetical protein